MKKLLIVLMFMPIFVYGQNKIIVSADSFFVACNKVVDIDSIWYKVYIARTYLDTTNQVAHDTTVCAVPDTFMLVNRTEQPEGNYTYGMSAIDEAGNESNITWGNNCNDPNMGGQCWYQSNDLTAPFEPRNVLPKFKQ